ncbi:MAG: phytanoyl-CoA dioxygenase family protein, partial [Hyphomicrobiales bacterium]|nr:phytanoyl-CoA dioxygenase family protein [Hyphomicrobiales bacterium]
SPVDIISANEAAAHRARMEQAEKLFGPVHYKTKMHTVLTSPLELATNDAVLDVVESLIGPDILLYNVTYIIKEAGSASHVSWHQDLTFWGFNDDAQVSMWLALSPATATSGCMRMISGSHKAGVHDHQLTEDETNVLYSGQTVNGVDEQNAVMCELQPGQASFHHGWTLHASMPNLGSDRRIGLNVQYLAPHMKQLKNEGDSALLVRGKDAYKHFEIDVPASIDLDPAAVAVQAALERRYQEIASAK